MSAAWAPSASACENISFDGSDYTVCRADPAADDLQLWLNDDEGDVFGTYDRLEQYLARNGQKLSFALNGGMYHEDRRPVGLYVEDGTELMRLVTREGPGNFGLLPNGVFCFGDGQASIEESREFQSTNRTCRFATQSGPMLVIDGNLHPRFRPESTSTFIRNGVGVTTDGTVVFAISNSVVNFDEFARLFRDRLEAPNALFLDGNVSRLFSENLARHDIGFPIGPIVGVARPAD